MAYSLIQLAGDWLTEDASDTEHACLKLPDDLRELLCRSHTAAHAWLSARRGIPSQTGLTIYVWSWVEAQVAAAVKIVPLGQRDGQRLLHQARAWIDTAVRVANNTPLEDAATAAFGLTILSARHETQYSRLFRS